MTLFESKAQQRLQDVAPLAERMRPASLDEMAGQAHLLGEGTMLRRMIDTQQLRSVIFYGPPGTGKTTLARLLARHIECRFEQGNASVVGVQEVRKVIERAYHALQTGGQRTVFFLDEIHRFSKSQQDVLLQDVERGTIVLVGATTENPFFSVNQALVSRASIFELQALAEIDIATLMHRAIADVERGLGAYEPQVDAEAIAYLATQCEGDARRALQAIDLAVMSEYKAKPDAPVHITLEVVKATIQHKAMVYDKNGDQHHDTISAFIKSVRGSDPDAAIYWLARMLASGEDPRFIARRVVILASEDVGNADPRALTLAMDAFQVVERIGMPEARITLAQVVTYMACAPKSNAAYMAINKAMDDVQNQRVLPVPKHLQNRGRQAKKTLGAGAGYQYAHAGDNGHVSQDYLSVDKSYYVPTERGYEKHMAAYLKWLKGEQPQANED